MRLNNKVAVVTGAAAGIGKAIAEKFLAEGAKVVFSDLHAIEGDLGPNALSLPCDVSKHAEVEKLVVAAIEKFGQLDIMVNNAGVGLTAPLTEMSDEIWDKVIAVNLSGVFYGTQTAAKYMKDRGIRGSIISITSI
jgi:NAD(P)-dependent dehydrogenase (short-subunit alcohol dehydrogenase family)